MAMKRQSGGEGDRCVTAGRREQADKAAGNKRGKGGGGLVEEGSMEGAERSRRRR